jgi:hypothetical protein
LSFVCLSSNGSLGSSFQQQVRVDRIAERPDRIYLQRRRLGIEAQTPQRTSFQLGSIMFFWKIGQPEAAYCKAGCCAKGIADRQVSKVDIVLLSAK